jgi:hypothetical protein
MIIDFTIRATDEETFRQRWITAGILEDTPSGYKFRPAYPGVELSCMGGWPGIITRTPAVLDANGNVVTPAELVPGWHCNARVTGPLAEAMTAGLPQVDENGNPLNLFQRTWASYIFNLTDAPQEIDPASGFPYEAKTVDDAVQYGDADSLKSPANVRQ